MPARRKDLNEATREDLEQIPQMSSARAETIIHYREQHGGFSTIEQLSEVPGIGATMAQQVSEYFSIRSGRSASSDENVGGIEADGEEDAQDQEEGGESGGGESPSRSRSRSSR